MESSKHWLDEYASTSVKDEAMADAEVPDLIIQPNDTVLNTKNSKYRRIMLIQYKKLGERLEGEETSALRLVGEEIFNTFKKGMGKKGRFWKKLRRGELYELLDDAEALDYITVQLRRRMDSKHHWLNVPMKELEKIGEEEEVQAKKPTANSSKPKPKRCTSPSQHRGSIVSLSEMNAVGNYNRGKLKDDTGVQYFKSHLGKDWVEQIVPRRTVGKKDSDVYYLSPDGLRFRSMADVNRHFDATTEVDEEDEEDVEMDEAPPTKPFAEALRDMITHVVETDPAVISWSPGGEAFYIHDQSQEKLGPYLLRFFNHNNFNSLYIQLNNYGFTQPPSFGGYPNGAFYHPDFRRKSSNTSRSRKRSAQTEDQEVEERPHKKQALPPSTTESDEGVTFNCELCKKDFHFANKKTASASFANHKRSCKKSIKSPVVKAKDTKVVKVPPKKKSPLPQKNASKKQVTFDCKFCNKSFTFASAQTAAASFAHHTRSCDPNQIAIGKGKKLKKKSVSPKKASSSPKTDTKKSITLVKKKSPEEKKKSRAKATPKPTITKKTSFSDAEENDIVLSLMSPKYKSIMEKKFKELGARKNADENPLLDEMKHELLSSFKKEAGTGGRLLKSDRSGAKTWVIDDKEALESKYFSMLLLNSQVCSYSYRIIHLLVSRNQNGP